MALELSSLRKGIEALDRAIGVLTSPTILAMVDLDTRETLRAGVIQNFEVAYELCWKHMKRWLESHAGAVNLDGVTRRELFRVAAEHLLIEDIEPWMQFHFARNTSSHTYDATVADEVVRVAQQFLPHAQRLFQHLEQHND